MSDMAMHHTPGLPEDDQNRQNQGPPQPPGPPGSHPYYHGAPQVYGGTAAGAQTSIGGYAPPMSSNQAQFHNAYALQSGPYQQHFAQDQSGVAGMTAQMGGMGLSEPMSPMGAATAVPGTTSRIAKKKQRAYHTLDQSPPTVSAAPPAQSRTPQPPAFQQYGSPHFTSLPSTPQFISEPSQPYQQPPGSQFPVPGSATTFVPANTQAPMHHSTTVSGRPGSASSRVDPNAVPSLPSARDAVQAQYNTQSYPTLAQYLAPPATTDFIAHDQGNSSPKFGRLTMNTIPATPDILASTALPLAWILQPFAKQKLEEGIVPVLDFGDSGPPRCRRCRAYINPFMTFTQGGAKFVCNMCSFPNEVPGQYYAHVDMTGRRVDREQRPELIRGTVEFIVPKEYWARPLEKGETVEDRALKWLFLIDVSMEASNRGGLGAIVQGIKAALYGNTTTEASEPNREGAQSEGQTDSEWTRLPKGTKVGIVTYDKEIHFYNLNSSLDQAQMIVMPDIEDPFLPLSNGLFVDPYESRSVIEPLLDSIPVMFAQIKNPEPALLPALNAALAAMEKTGGKIICSLSSLPTWGPGRLFLREDTNVLGTEKEKILFSAEHQSWRKIAVRLVEAGVGIDFFMTPHAYIDVATIGHVAATTGGETFFYPNFVTQRDSSRLIAEITHSVHRETGYQALMKVRCSNGLQVSSYAGNFLQKNPTADLEFGSIDADKSIGVSFTYDGKLDSKQDAHFQAALLYTTRTGERRVRCINHVAAVTEVGKEGLRFVDQDAVVGLIAKEAASKMTEKPLKEIRNGIMEKCVEILAAYRKNFTGSNPPPGQLVLPEALKEFALYMLCLLKVRAIRGGQVSSDMRINSSLLLKSMSLCDLSHYLYPRIYALHSLAEDDLFPDTSQNLDATILKLPPTIRASFARVDEGGAYLVDNGQTCLMYELPVLDTHLNIQVRNLIQFLAGLRGSKSLRIQLARQAMDGAVYEFGALLVEDRNNDAQSYVDWLVHVHKYVQLEVRGQRQKDDIAQAADAAVSAANFTGLRPPYW